MRNALHEVAQEFKEENPSIGFRKVYFAEKKVEDLKRIIE